MTSTYLMPVCDSDGCYIAHATARNHSEAEEKLIQELIETYELDDTVYSFSELKEVLNEYDIVIGDIYDIEEF